MKSKIILLVVILFGLSGCATGPATHKEWRDTRNFNIGSSLLHRGYTDKDKKIYDKNHYIYILEYPKNCIFGYLVKKNDKKKTIVGWKIISGKEYCKEREETVLIQ